MIHPDEGRSLSQMSLAEAKSEGQGREDYFVSRISASLVESLVRVDPGSLRSCGDGAYQWSGGVTVALKETSRAAELLVDVEASLAEDDGFSGLSSEPRRGRPDNRDFVLREAHRASCYVSSRADGAAVLVTSFSPCVQLDGLPSTGLSYWLMDSKAYAGARSTRCPSCFPYPCRQQVRICGCR